jgi:GT2 family glycosyltransferase
LDKVGLFDERFFMYFEDLDLCRRFWEAGFEVWYLAGVEMVHYHQRLSADSNALLAIFSKAARIHIVSGVKYFAKYLGVKVPR